MSRVQLEHTGEVVIDAPVERVLALVRDPCAWGGLQPYCERVWREPGDIYGWEFGDMVVAGIRLRPRYQTQVFTNGQDRVWWLPRGPQDFACEGSWQLGPAGDIGTTLQVNVSFSATLNYPQGLVDLFTPLARTEFARQIQTLLQRLAAALADRTDRTQEG